ncbi:MAG TPA: amidohydrolase family protein [Vicinamibacterales bacterium]|nr:amidohydrolase family protein [Vicinamibacterales bacterium]
MGRSLRLFSVLSIVVVFAVAGLARQSRTAAAPIDVTVQEGTSMSVAISPDGRTLAIDLQGGIWTVPAAGGPARRVTGIYEDARQPTWSPDGKWITYFGYKDGGYDLWSIAPDGSGQQRLTWGPFDDREPAWSHDGTRVAFSSDRGNPLGSDYNIWVLDARTGELRQLTKDPSEDFMPTWSPDDREIAFASTRENSQSIWAVSVGDLSQRKVATVNGARLDAPSWSSNGQIVYHATSANQSRYEVGGTAITGSENVFAFRASWSSPTEFFYVSDGKIRKRTLGTPAPQTVAFTATLQVTHPEYTRRVRDFTSNKPRKVLGIVRPSLSPDGSQIAFAAVGDIWVVPSSGGKPVNVTNDSALDTDPAWSPDGASLVYSSDKTSPQLQLWVRDMKTGQAKQVTNLSTQPQGASFSPDGKRIVFFNVDGMWRVAQISVLDLAAGTVTKIHDTLPQPGAPVWSPDGTRVALAGVAPLSTRFREGTNQVLTISTTGGADEWQAPVAMMGVDSRGGGGVAWSPDGTKMAGIYGGLLSIWPVSRNGAALGPPRPVTSELAHSPSWQGDSRHILYQSYDALKILDVETGELRTVPLDFQWTPAIPTSRIVVHAGKLIDMTSPAPRTNVDVLVEGNRIVNVVPHADANHSRGQFVDASQQTVMPGLTEFHSHLQKDYGAAQGRAWLAFGITTVRSPGNTPYEAVEDREANEAGVRPGPRVYGTGYLMEWNRVYYKMGIAISSVSQFEMELQRAKVLEHDLIKSYVRLPDPQQKRMVEFAHSIGVPVATHEIFPASFVGVDNTEHTSATSRRGYSPKMATLQTAYDDVIQLFGKSARIFCPMISGGGARKLFELDPALKNDARFKLYPEWIQRQVAGQPAGGNPGGGGDPAGGSGKMVLNVMKAGGLVVAGTDTPNAVNLHGELMAYTLAGMSAFDALKTATVNPAKALNLNAGTIEAGKFADIILLDGDPLENIANTLKVRRVIANGRLYNVDDLAGGPAPATAARQ